MRPLGRRLRRRDAAARAPAAEAMSGGGPVAARAASD